MALSHDVRVCLEMPSLALHSQSFPFYQIHIFKIDKEHAHGEHLSRFLHSPKCQSWHFTALVSN